VPDAAVLLAQVFALMRSAALLWVNSAHRRPPPRLRRACLIARLVLPRPLVVPGAAVLLAQVYALLLSSAILCIKSAASPVSRFVLEHSSKETIRSPSRQADTRGIARYRRHVCRGAQEGTLSCPRRCSERGRSTVEVSGKLRRTTRFSGHIACRQPQ
jgi:hypothetical protein